MLRLIQEKEYRPVGSVERRKVDFRVIAATNRDLAKEWSAAGSAATSTTVSTWLAALPALRESREDIPALIEHFLAQYGERHVLTRECLDAMIAYDWPGNVRELETYPAPGGGQLRPAAAHRGPAEFPAEFLAARKSELPSMVARRRSGGFGRGGAACGQKLLGCAGPLAHGNGEDGHPPALEYTKGDRVMAAPAGIGRTSCTQAEGYT